MSALRERQVSFDFSGFSHNPPRGCKIQTASHELRLKTHIGTVFIVRENNGEFSLWSITGVDRLEQFNMRTRELHRILRLLGYKQIPNVIHNVKERRS
jgi:hypothetical protein